jgi:hypothetical protein
MVLDDGLVAPGDEDEMLDARLACLIDNDWMSGRSTTVSISFRHRLGGGQKAGAKTGNGKDGLADGTGHFTNS